MGIIINITGPCRRGASVRRRVRGRAFPEQTKRGVKGRQRGARAKRLKGHVQGINRSYALQKRQRKYCSHYATIEFILIQMNSLNKDAVFRIPSGSCYAPLCLRQQPRCSSALVSPQVYLYRHAQLLVDRHGERSHQFVQQLQLRDEADTRGPCPPPEFHPSLSVEFDALYQRIDYDSSTYQFGPAHW